MTSQEELAMSSFTLVLPEDFHDYEWEVEAKGYFTEAKLSASGKNYRLNFFESVRLQQEIKSDLERVGVFFEPNLVVVSSVTRANMERAAEVLVQLALESLVAE